MVRIRVLPASATGVPALALVAGDERVTALMPAGSCILLLGNLWHGGGENRSDRDRLALTAKYCEPWLRTQENYFLSVKRETVARLSEDRKRLLGYSIHPPFMGMVDGTHPRRKLPGCWAVTAIAILRAGNIACPQSSGR